MQENFDEVNNPEDDDSEDESLESEEVPVEPQENENNEALASQEKTSYQVNTEAGTGNITSVVGDNPYVTINYLINFVRGIEEESRYYKKVSSKDTLSKEDQLLKENLLFERQNNTFLRHVANKAGVDKRELPEDDKEFSDWYYDIDLYEQCYVQSVAILHGAPAHEVSKRADYLYKIHYAQVEQRENSYLPNPSSEDQPEKQEQFVISTTLVRKPSRQLQADTCTNTRRVDGVERVFWQDVDSYGLSNFGLLVLIFLANEFLNRGEQGQAFLKVVREWSEEQYGECPQRAAHALGVILWHQNVHQLQDKAVEWAKKGSSLSRRRSASFLDGAYEIERIKDNGQGESADTSFVLHILNEWTLKIHNELHKGDPLKASNMYLGCTVANTCCLIGKKEPEVALDRLERLLKLPISRDTKEIRAIYTAGVSAYVSLTWSGHIRDVLKKLASNAEDLSHTWILPQGIEARRSYRQQREVRLRANFEAFFLIAALATSSLPITDPSPTYRESLSEQIAVPDLYRRDILLTAILTGDELRASILKLLCSAVVSIHSKPAFDLLYQWTEIVLSIQEKSNKDGGTFYILLLDFLIELGQTIDNWCIDLSKQGYRSLSGMETYQKKLEQWQKKGHKRLYSAEPFFQEVLQGMKDKVNAASAVVER